MRRYSHLCLETHHKLCSGHFTVNGNLRPCVCWCHQKPKEKGTPLLKGWIDKGTLTIQQIATARRKLVNNNQYWTSRAGSLNRYARNKGAEGRVSGVALKTLYLQSYGLCHWCGVEMILGSAYTPSQSRRVMSFDHVIRLADGGENVIENLVCACRSCNAGRHDGSAERGIVPETS